MTLTITYNGTGTLYAIYRRISDNYVWNGTSFEAWSDASISTYAQDLTNDSGDVYTIDVPAAIGTTAVRAMFYEQTETQPLTTDNLLKTRLVNTGEVSLSPYALATVDQVKTSIGLSLSDTTEDVLLAACINAATDLCEKACRRRFVARDYVEWVTQAGSYIKLSARPIQRIYRAAISTETAMLVYYNGSVIRASIEVLTDQIVLYTLTADGDESTTYLKYSDYKTVSRMSSAINGISGWSSTVSKDGLCKELRPSAPLYIAGADGQSVAQVYIASATNLQYNVRNEEGIVGINWVTAGWFIPVMFSYRGGYETDQIPALLNRICVEIAVNFYRFASTNLNVQSESQLDYSYSLNNTQLMKSMMDRYQPELDILGDTEIGNLL